jgi:hypothetical protein
MTDNVSGKEHPIQADSAVEIRRGNMEGRGTNG